MKIADQIEDGKASETVHIGESAMLGVSVVSNGDTTGAVVGDVLADGKADEAGIEAGDVITSFAGKTVESAHSLSSLLNEQHPGDKVEVGWVDQAGQQHKETIERARSADADTSATPALKGTDDRVLRLLSPGRHRGPINTNDRARHLTPLRGTRARSTHDRVRHLTSRRPGWSAVDRVRRLAPLRGVRAWSTDDRVRHLVTSEATGLVSRRSGPVSRSLAGVRAWSVVDRVRHLVTCEVSGAGL